MNLNRLTILASIMILILAVLCLRPVPIRAEKDCISLKATVTAIYEGGVKDVIFMLDGHRQRFYINRGLERGLDLMELKQDLIGREILIKYPEYWTPLDPNRTSVHISKVEHAGRTVFTELN